LLKNKTRTLNKYLFWIFIYLSREILVIDFLQISILLFDNYYQIKMRFSASLSCFYFEHSISDLDIVFQKLIVFNNNRISKFFVDQTRFLIELFKILLYSNFLDFFEYWRIWLQIKAQQLYFLNRYSNYRSLIADFEYWKTETKFLIFRAIYCKKQQLQIRDVDYWRIELLYWFNAWIKKNILARQQNINNLVYWKYKIVFWIQTTIFTRENIVNAEYWQTEIDYYNLQLNSLAVDTILLLQLTIFSKINKTSIASFSRLFTRALFSIEVMQFLNLSIQQQQNSRLCCRITRTQQAENTKFNENKILFKRRKKKLNKLI